MKKTYTTKAVKQESLQTRLKKYAEDLALANKKLHEQEKQLEVIIDHIPALISYVDSEERYRFCNRVYEEWLGNTRGNMYGKTMKEVRGPEVYKVIKPYVKKALAGQQVTYDNSMRKKDGSFVHFTATYVPHFDTNGNVQGFFILAIDITERKLAEDRLKEKEAQFRHLEKTGN